MSITISDGATTLALNSDLLWADELSWHPVEQSVERSLTGALIVDVNTKVGGRPITLQPEDESSGWMQRSTVETLRNWAAVAGKTLTLTLRGTARTVMFRHHEGAALDAAPIQHFSDVDADDWYRCTLRFMEVEA
jgi:hypothetical protein